ncbi:hypothetical protein SNE40_006523 [Patella caerulea]
MQLGRENTVFQNGASQNKIEKITQQLNRLTKDVELLKRAQQGNRHGMNDQCVPGNEDESYADSKESSVSYPDPDKDVCETENYDTDGEDDIEEDNENDQYWSDQEKNDEGYTETENKVDDDPGQLDVVNDGSSYNYQDSDGEMAEEYNATVKHLMMLNLKRSRKLILKTVDLNKGLPGKNSMSGELEAVTNGIDKLCQMLQGTEALKKSQIAEN